MKETGLFSRKDLSRWGLLLAFGFWWAGAGAQQNHAIYASADECQSDPYCAPGVCVNGQCAPCTEAPGQCSNHPGLTEPFCDESSGDCWENTDCDPWVGNPEQMSCTPCTDWGAMECPGYWQYCDPQSGLCTEIP